MSYRRLSESERKTLCAERAVPFFPRKPGHTFVQHPAGYVVQYEDAEAEALIASPSRAMVSIPIDPRKAAEQARGPQTFGEAVRSLREMALTSSSATERANAKKMLERLDAPTASKETKMANQTRAYSSPMGDIPSKKNDKSASDGDDKDTFAKLLKTLRSTADDPKNPQQEQAKELLRLLNAFLDVDEDDSEASEDTEDATRPKGVPAAARGRAKALNAKDGPTRLSPYAAMLDEQMGLSTRQGIRVEGDQLILSSAGHKVKP